MTAHADHDDFAVEPIPGLPAHLPKGEKILWQGGPEWKTLAVKVFHLRKIAIIFAVIAAWRLVNTAYDGGSVVAMLPEVAVLALFGLAGIGILALIAYAMARTTIYTITTKRVVMRIGVALSVTFNIPFKVVEAAALKPAKGGVGDISLELEAESRISYAALWPHARPWHVNHPQPSLRAIADAQAVADLLASAVADASSEPVYVAESATGRAGREQARTFEPGMVAASHAA